MPSSFPTAADNLTTTHQPLVEKVAAADINAIAFAVNAIQNALLVSGFLPRLNLYRSTVGLALDLQHTVDLAGGVADLVNIVLQSTGDAIYVMHKGGAPVGYGGPQGADAAFNVLIPGNIDGTTAGNGWDGTTLNTRTGMAGLVVYSGAAGSYPISVNSWSVNPALSLYNQQTGHTQGNGPAIYADHDGTGALLQALHRGNSFTNPSLSFTSFGTPAQDRQLLTSRVTGDANSRFTFDYKGLFTWGPGSATQDIFLARFAAKTLVLDEGVMARMTGADANATTAYSTIRNSENQTRFQIRHDGTHWWGDGTNSADTNLYRGAADQLRTDDSVRIGGSLRVETRPAFVASDRYLVVDSNGNVHVSALGPAS